MKSRTTRVIPRLLELGWLCALAAALLVSALTTDRRARQVEENPAFCDPFGYLQMAQDIRAARASSTTPRFTLETAHTRLLVEFMKSSQLPTPVWDEMVAPLAYHYFPAADHVAVQYSPGAGLVLALFPQGRALHGLNRLVIAIFVVAGLVMLVVSAIRRLPVAAGLFVLALSFGLEILGQLDNASFSMNALLAPLLLSGVTLAAAQTLVSEKPRSSNISWFLTLVAGLLFGFALLARMPVVLLLPGILLLLWPQNIRTWYKSACLAFLLGVFVGGVTPIAIHQQRVAGAWYLPTYAHENSTPPTLECFWSNVSYYFGPGKSSAVNWVLPVAGLAFVCLILWSVRRDTNAPSATVWPRPGWIKLSAAAVLMLGLSNAYFLTHVARVHYYTWPALFGALLVLALGAFALEHQWSTRIHNQSRLRAGLLILALAFSFVPGVIVMARAWSQYTPASTEIMPRSFSLPADLGDESAWIWACELSGTLWYYARKPAHKLTSTNAETRELVYKFVRDRGEPQYVVIDDESMQALADEIVQLGGSLERRGEVYGYPYFLIHWPGNKP
jgi:hypothetical protein